MITDRSSGQFRGFCFVEMETSAANAAISALDNHEMDGRTLKVNEAKPREERGGGQRGGGDFRGGNNNRDNNRGGYNRSR
jgi:RNA recognition motif-containing protein